MHLVRVGHRELIHQKGTVDIQLNTRVAACLISVHTLNAAAKQLRLQRVLNDVLTLFTHSVLMVYSSSALENRFIDGKSLLIKDIY